MRTLIVIVGLLALLPIGALAGSRGDPIAVVDANGKPVGTVVGAGIADATIALSANGRSVLLDVTLGGEHRVFPGRRCAAAFSWRLAAVVRESGLLGPAPRVRAPESTSRWAAIAPPGLTLYLPAVRRRSGGSYCRTAQR